MPRVWLLAMDPGSPGALLRCERLSFAEEAHDVGLASHFEFDADRIVVAYDSLITPLQHLEIPLADPGGGARRVLKEKRVPGYDKEAYGCERVLVPSRDGATEIPVNLVYRKDVLERQRADGLPVHAHLYGYGSYSACIEASFSATRLALLNRGVVFATAQIRGGGEMGRSWYEEPIG
jgi:oligopeptidase B